VTGTIVDRRTFGAGLLALLAVRPAAASDLPADVAAAIRAAFGDATPVDAGIALQLPTVAENGAQVPLTVTVEGTPTRDRFVRAIHLFATRNPTLSFFLRVERTTALTFVWEREAGLPIRAEGTIRVA
jgi:sulfur-oxidizing protein SoxY